MTRDSSVRADGLDRVQKWILLGLVAATPLAILRIGLNAFQTPKVTLLAIGAIALGSLGAARALIARALPPWKSPVVLAATTFLLAAVVATAVAPSPVRSVVGGSSHHMGLAAYGALVVILVVVATMPDRTAIRSLVLTMTSVSLVVSGYGIIQSFGRDPLRWQSAVRPVFSTLGNSNFLSGYAGIIAALSLGVAMSRTRRRPERAGGATAFALGLLVAVRSHSFQGLVAAGVGCGLVLVCHARSLGSTLSGLRRRNGRFLALVAAAAVILVLATAPRLVRFARHGVETGLRERSEYWHAARAVFAEDPVTGSGIDSFGDYYFTHRWARASSGDLAEDPHSVPIAMFTDGGVVLGAAYLLFVGSTAATLVRSFRGANEEDRELLVALAGAWAAYQTQSLVSIDTAAVALLHFAVAGSIVAISVQQGSTAPPVPPKTARRPSRTRDRNPRRAKLSAVETGALSALAMAALAAAWLATRPARADLAAGRADALIDSGRAVSALEPATRATELAPWEGRYWFLRAAALEAANDLDGARGAAERAASVEVGSPTWAEFSARLALKAKDYVAASRWYETALQRDPYSPKLLARAAGFYTQLGNRHRAVDLARRGIRLDDSVVALWFELARAERMLGDELAAADAYRRVLELSPGDREATGFLDALARQ